MRDELGFAAGQEDDFDLALLALDERRASNLNLFFVGACVGNFDGAAVADLKTILVARS